MNKKRIAIFSSIIILIVVAVGLSGLFLKENIKPDVSDQTVSNAALKENIVQTICDVSEKTVIEQEDIDSFQLLAKELIETDAPTVEEQDLYNTAAEQILSLASSWEYSMNQEMSESNSAALIQLCTAAKEAYDPK